MAHGGARAGASLPLINHWASVLGAKDPDTLKAELGVTRDWVDGYARMAGQNKPVVPRGQISPVPGGAGADPLDKYLIKK